MTTTTNRQPANFTFTDGGRYESECPSCNTRIVRYHAGAPDCRMVDTVENDSGRFDCAMCGLPLYVNRVQVP